MDGAESDSGLFLHSSAGEGDDFRGSFSSLSASGISGLMVRDSDSPDAPFVFAGSDGAGELIVRYRHTPASPAQTLEFGAISANSWVRLIVGRDTVYAFSAEPVATATPGEWDFLAAIKIELDGGEWGERRDDLGGVFVSNGNSDLDTLCATSHLLWSEVTTKSDAATTTGAWTSLFPTPDQVSESASLLTGVGDGSPAQVDFPVTVKAPGTYRFFLHVPAGNPDTISTRIVVGSSNGTTMTRDNLPGGRNSWLYVDTATLAAGETARVQLFHPGTPGLVMHADAARAVLVPDAETNALSFPGWTKTPSQTDRIALSDSGAASNDVKRRPNGLNGQWNAGANSVPVLVGDGKLRFRFIGDGLRMQAGLTANPAGNDPAGITYRFFNKGSGKVQALGGNSPEFNYVSGDWMEIERVGRLIIFRRLMSSGTVPNFRHVTTITDEVPPPYLHIDATLLDEDARVYGARVTGRWESVAGADDLDGDDVPDVLERPVIDADAEDGMQSVFDVDYNDDPDEDGLTNAEEVTHGTLPENPDSDGDGLLDGDEVGIHQTDPTSEDTDGDGLSDGYEVTSDYGFDPKKRFTINDGVSDYTRWEILEHDPTLNLLSDVLPDADYDNDGVINRHESSDGTSAVNPEDWFRPVIFDRILGDYEGAEWQIDQIDTVSSSRLVRTAPFGNPSGGVSHHEAVDGTRVRFQFSNLVTNPSGSEQIAVGFSHRELGADEPGDLANYAFCVKPVGPGEAQIFFFGQPAPTSTPFSITPEDLMELRLELTEGVRRIHLAKNFQPLTSVDFPDAFSSVDLETHPLAVVVRLGEENNTVHNLRYRGTNDPDFDNDQMSDRWERQIVVAFPLLFSNVEEVFANGDADGDGILNSEEFRLGLKGHDPDSDGDGMWDGWELLHSLNPLMMDQLLDPDSDGVTNIDEFLNHLDYDEPGNFGFYSGATDPRNADTDGDGIPDSWEMRAAWRNPTFAEPSSDNVDGDGDGIPDLWEVENGLDMTDPNDGIDDPDFDGISAKREFEIGGVISTWTHVEIIGGLGELGTVPRNAIDLAAGEFSLNALGELARVHDTGYDYQLEVWDRGDWEVRAWLGKKGNALQTGFVRLNDFGDAAAVVWSALPVGGNGTEVEVRHVDHRGAFHVIGRGEGWRSIDRLELTNSGWVAGLVRLSNLSSAAFRWRRGHLEVVPLPSAELNYFGGVLESGAWGDFYALRPFTAGEQVPLDQLLGGSGTGLILHTQGGHVFCGYGGAPFGAGYAATQLLPNGASYGLTPVGTVPFPVAAPPQVEPFFETVLRDVNSRGEAVGWFGDPAPRNPNDPVDGDIGFLWRGDRLVAIPNLPYGSDADHRFHAINDRGCLLSSFSEWVQDHEEIDNGLGDGGTVSAPSGYPYLTRRWFLSRPDYDLDGDGVADDWELELGDSDHSDDADGDGLSDRLEFALGTNPASRDSDGDGLADLFESRSGLDPRLAIEGESESDEDEDLLTALDEQNRGTDPLSGDSDEDGTPDALDPEVDEPHQPQPIVEWQSRLARIQWNGPSLLYAGADSYTHPYALSDDSDTGENPDELYTTDAGETYSEGELFTASDQFRASVLEDYSHFGEGRFVTEDSLWNGVSEIAHAYWAPPGGNGVGELGSAQRADVRLIADRSFPEGAIFFLSLTEERAVLGAGFSHFVDFVAVFRFVPHSTFAKVTLVEIDGVTPLALSSVDDHFIRAFPGLASGKHLGVHAKMIHPSIDIVPDWTRDGRINDDDRESSLAGTPWRWWKNDDDDSGDFDSSGADTPKADRPDFWDDEVDGTRDLVDFFPLHLDLQEMLRILPDSKYDYFLIHKGDVWAPSFGVVWYPEAKLDLDPSASDSVGGFLRNVDRASELSTRPVTHIRYNKKEGIPIPASMLDAAKRGEGVALLEARFLTDKPLAIEIRDRVGWTVARSEFPVKISNVERMYRHVDLRRVPKNRDGSDAGGEESSFPGREKRDDPGDYYPDYLTNGKYFAFIHGFNVTEKKARGWHAEIFKRLHQMGSRARFVGVSWFGDTGKIPGTDSSLNYHQAVFHAFQTGDALASNLGFCDGDLTVAAHSLGNIVASHAIAEGGLAPARYYMINAAAPIEAYNSAGTEWQNLPMTEATWKRYGNTPHMQRIFSARWYDLFDEGDPRRRLGWKDRFKPIVESFDLVNFYSSGEDVVQNPENDSANLVEVLVSNSGLTRGAWGNQEMVKGTVYAASIFQEPSQAGWGFDSRYIVDYVLITGVPIISCPDYESASSFSKSLLQGSPVFSRFLDNGLTDPNQGPILADQTLVRYHVVAGGIPALSYAVAANAVEGIPGYNMQVEFKVGPAGWPEEGHEASLSQDKWLHSDFYGVSLPFVHKMYQKMIELGHLDE